MALRPVVRAEGVMALTWACTASKITARRAFLEKYFLNNSKARVGAGELKLVLTFRACESEASVLRTFQSFLESICIWCLSAGER